MSSFEVKVGNRVPDLDQTHISVANAVERDRVITMKIHLKKLRLSLSTG